MMDFILNNLGTLIVAAVLAVVLVLIIVKLARDRKKGACGGCYTSCDGCPSAGVCHTESSSDDGEGKLTVDK
jgi:hypothetical protein